MCGIFGVVRSGKISVNNLQTYSKGFYSLFGRGPDQQQLTKIGNVLIGFARLSIMEPEQSGMQPFWVDLSETGERVFMVCNGEIYNFQELVTEYALPGVGRRDCEVLLHLYLKLGFAEFAQLFERKVRGEFAFAVFRFDKDSKLTQVVLGRDLLGVRPLYVSTDMGNKYAESLAFGSSLESVQFHQGEVNDFEPGTISRFFFDQDALIDRVETTRFDTIYDDSQYSEDWIKDQEEGAHLVAIRESLVKAVQMRLDADQPICFLLSGGLDSSVVCSIAQAQQKEPIHTFCCGVAEEGQASITNDILAARKVAAFLGTNHTEVTFTREEAMEVVPKIVKHCGTYDVTTIRASIGMYFVCKYIAEKTRFKVVISSDLSDEILVYLFAFQLANGIQVHKAAKTLVKEVHKYDIVRVDRIVSGVCSLEARLPFSDQDYIKACWSVPPHLRHPKVQGHGKYWLRKAFDCQNAQGRAWLPDEVLWRVKSAFSDELMSNQARSLIDEIEATFADEREEYKQLFIQQFGTKRLSVLPHYWQPLYFDQDNEPKAKEYVDPSATRLPCFASIQPLGK